MKLQKYDDGYYVTFVDGVKYEVAESEFGWGWCSDSASNGYWSTRREAVRNLQTWLDDMARNKRAGLA